MTGQLELDLQPLVEIQHEPDLTVAERFAAFHEANPHVAHALELLAARWLAAGHERVSIVALYERLRWESGITTAGDAYRLNNSYRPLYARLLIERRPEWAEAFELRKLKAA